MSKLILISFCFISVYCNSQAVIELGYKQNFLVKSKSFENVSSNTFQAMFGLNAQSFPIYGGVNTQLIQVKDEIFSSNRENIFQLGIKAGIRPLAKTLVFPIQPFIESSYNFTIGDSTKTSIKNTFNFGGGLEVYFTKRSCIAISYCSETYFFSNKQTLENKTAQISLRFNLR